MRNRSTLIFGILVAMICLAFVPAVSAYSAELISPASESTVLNSGSSILINLKDLADGDHVTYKLISNDLVVPGSTINLPSTNMPFDFKNGLAHSTMTTTGVDPIKWTITKEGSGTVFKEGSGTLETSYNIKKGNYLISIEGTKTGGDIGINYNVTGTVDTGTGIPNPAPLSFTITGVNSGHLTIQIPQATGPKNSWTFTIAVPTPTPTPVPTYSSGDTGGPGPAAAPAAAPAQLAPVAQVVTGLITELVSSGAVTTTTLPGGVSPTSLTLEVGSNAGIGGTPGGSVSISPGTSVTNLGGTPVTTLGGASVNLWTSPATGSTFVDLSGMFGMYHGVTTLYIPGGVGTIII